MKILSLIALIFLANTSFSQIKFYTDNGAEETKAIDCFVEDLKLAVTIPEQAKNHEAIVIQYESSPEVGERWNDYYWKKEFSEKFLQGKSKLEFWLKKPGVKTGEFCRGDDCNQLFIAKNYYDRNYVTQPLRVQIYGKDFSKMVWENGDQVKKYKFTLIESADLAVDYGPIMITVPSKDNLFQLDKFKLANGYAELFKNTDENYMTSELYREGKDGVNFIVTEIKVGESSEETFDMSGGGGSSSSSSAGPVEDIKMGIERALFLTVNERTKRYIPKPTTNYVNNLISQSVFQPMLKSKGSVSSYSKEAKRFNKRADYMTWKTGKFGNFDGQILEIPVYKMSQVKMKDKAYRLKEEEKGKTQTLKVFIGESDGKVFVATLTALGTEKLDDEEINFWNHIEKTFKLN